MAQPYQQCAGCGRIQTNHHSGRCTRCRAGLPPPVQPPPAARAPRAPGGARRRRWVPPAVNQGIPLAAVTKGAGDLLLEALAKLEDALVARADEQGVGPELAKQFERYQKVKALALHPMTGDNEKQAALRTCLVEAIRMVV